jgi:hypothetical protein
LKLTVNRVSLSWPLPTTTSRTCTVTPEPQK